jgi:hypothetical protein
MLNRWTHSFPWLCTKPHNLEREHYITHRRFTFSCITDFETINGGHTFNPVALIFSANWSTATLLGAQTKTWQLSWERRKEVNKDKHKKKKNTSRKCLAIYLSLTLFGHVIYKCCRSYSLASSRWPLNQTNRPLKNTLNSKHLRSRSVT